MDIIITLICILICVRLFKSTQRLSNGEFLNLFYIGYYIVQLIIALVLVLIDPYFSIGDYATYRIKDLLTMFSIAIIVACIAINLAQRLCNRTVVSKNVSYDDQISFLNSFAYPNRVAFVFLILFLFSILSCFNLGYLFQVAALSFSFTPIIVGLIWRKLNTANRCLWCVFLFINFVFHTMQGGRGNALFPIVFLIIGYVLSIKTNKILFKKRIVVFAVIGVIIMPFLSFTAMFRENMGRGLDVNTQTLNLLLDYGGDYLVGNIKEEEGHGVSRSIGRILIGANIVVPSLVPSTIPYRGTEAMGDEFFSIFKLGGAGGNESSLSARDQLKYGTGVANNYGFRVNEYTSVEWPVFADGYSRFGIVGLWVYSFLFAYLLSYLEKRGKSLYSSNAFLATVVTFFFLYNGSLSYMYSYASFLKLLIFRLVFVVIITLVITPCVKRKNIV